MKAYERIVKQFRAEAQTRTLQFQKTCCSVVMSGVRGATS